MHRLSKNCTGSFKILIRTTMDSLIKKSLLNTCSTLREINKLEMVLEALQL